MTATAITAALDRHDVPARFGQDPELRAIAYSLHRLESPDEGPEARFYAASSLLSGGTPRRGSISWKTVYCSRRSTPISCPSAWRPSRISKTDSAQGPTEAFAAPNETSREGTKPMSGETSITVIGNLTNDPELRFTQGGSAVANFTIASTPRTFDRQKNEWVDGETLFLPASVWRDAAEHVAESLTKGMRVIASGLLKPRTYETKAGEKRTVVELEVEEIGLSMRFQNVAVSRTRSVRKNDSSGDGGDGTYRPISEPAPQFTDDDPWFGKEANPEGRIHHPGPNGEPAYW
jgi:single-strand DNA-binding protein